MADQKEKKLCVDCKTKEVFQGQLRFDRCFSCARINSGKKYEEYVSTLTHDQVERFKKYKVAEQEFTSMVILD